MDIVKNHPLQKHNTFGLEAHAKQFVRLNSTKSIIELIKSPVFQQSGQKLVIGDGSNILFTGDFEGLVMKIDIPGIHVVKEDKNTFLSKPAPESNGTIWWKAVLGQILVA